MRTASLLLLLLASCGQPEPPAPEPHWYRGNLHTHTFWSDGDDFPEMVVNWYRDAGYDFLSLSDHNELGAGERWIVVDEQRRPTFDTYIERMGADRVDTIRVTDTTRVRLKTFDEVRSAFSDPGRFLLIQGEEITDSVDRHPIHVNATNVVDFIPPQGGATVAEALQRNVDAVLAQREQTGQPMFPHINHPNFGWAMTVDDLLSVEGERFFEIYNGHPLVHNPGDEDHISVEQMWDIILATRLADGQEPMYGLAVDDAHHYQGMDVSLANPGRGWVMVNADSLTPRSIIAALESGQFYASTGVTLRDIRRSAARIEVEIDPAEGVSYRTDFIGSYINQETGETAIGTVLASVEGTEPSYELLSNEIYARARIVSDKPKFNPNRPEETEVAWTQPVFRAGGLN